MGLSNNGNLIMNRKQIEE